MATVGVRIEHLQADQWVSIKFFISHQPVDKTLQNSQTSEPEEFNILGYVALPRWTTDNKMFRFPLPRRTLRYLVRATWIVGEGCGGR